MLPCCQWTYPEYQVVHICFSFLCVCPNVAEEAAHKRSWHHGKNSKVDSAERRGGTKEKCSSWEDLLRLCMNNWEGGHQEHPKQQKAQVNQRSQTCKVTKGWNDILLWRHWCVWFGSNTGLGRAGNLSAPLWIWPWPTQRIQTRAEHAPECLEKNIGGWSTIKLNSQAMISDAALGPPGETCNFSIAPQCVMCYNRGPISPVTAECSKTFYTRLVWILTKPWSRNHEHHLQMKKTEAEIWKDKIPQEKSGVPKSCFFRGTK